MSRHDRADRPTRRGKPSRGFPRRRPKLRPEEIPPLRYPDELPISQKKDEIVQAIRENPVVVVTGDTGSGKSTQLPKMCLEAGCGRRGLIGSTQPRRVAAVTLSRRVAEEMNVPLGGFVGYKIRFQERVSAATRIKFMTDGILLAEAQSDKFFKAYDTLIIDEAHERSLNIDFLLGLLRRVLARRRDLKVVITSATIDPESFSRAFHGAPIIHVSGRTYPVRVVYRPASEDTDGESTYVDEAVKTVCEMRREGARGDVLVFMPTESDIRETVARLEEQRFPHTVVLPLFGRLAGSDQERVFRPLSQDKIVVATNVAETSVTIPGIRYVVDTGLARLAMYNPRSRTQGLPIVPISRASADQRKGRCGRVGPGVCLRLYSEEDYLNRAEFTPPEIQRSNLAEVILKMLAGRLGDIRTFPFLDPPAPSAVKDGYAVLQELGAVDARRHLTALGRQMARFPLDPRLSRMLIQAQKEGAVEEMIVLCAALSIQDPRERPLEQEAQADQAHARFKDRRSDFLTLLNIWKAYHQKWKEAGSQNQLRKFCREHFLSYRRMREWVNVAEEIRGILEEAVDLHAPAKDRAPASYEAIHRCVVSGYLSHVAMKKEKNIYQGTKGRRLMIFPGSALFNKGGEWIVAAEIVQTSRLFARTTAVIDPAWLEDLGRHLVKRRAFEPHWEKRRGQVVAYERVTLFGLPIVDRRKVDYARYDPEDARRLFIRSALVEGETVKPYAFLEHNRKLRQELERMEEKLRRRELVVDDEAVFAFYDRRLPQVADIRTFERWLKDQGSDAPLRMTEEDLLQAAPNWEALEHFPDSFAAGDVRLPLSYAFCPGEEEDGVTATVPIHVLPRLDPEPFQWLVPGLLADKILHLLRSLPKHYRRRIVPIPETAQRVMQELIYGEGDFYVALSAALERAAGVQVPVAEWDRRGLPEHLKMRFRVVDAQEKVIQTGRDLLELQATAVGSHQDAVWRKARRQWEREGLTAWDFGSLPQRIELGRDAFGVMRCAYPGLAAEGNTVAVRLYADPQEAMLATRDGLLVLYQWTFAPVLKTLRKEWIFPVPARTRPGMTPLPLATCTFLGDLKEAERRLHLYILRELFDLHDPQLPDEDKYRRTVRELPARIGPRSRELWQEVLEVVRERYQVTSVLQKYRERSRGNPPALARLDAVAREVQQLVPPDFLVCYRREQMGRLPRYLKGLGIRAERAYVAPEKDVQKWRGVEPYQARYEEALAAVGPDTSREVLCFLDEFRWMLEEYKLSLFAPEIKTRFPISAKRLKAKWAELPTLKV
ncbi:ATP-dependent helicase HrpA [Desulfacinum hydrothermale DSM 13146]|uniref:ATP-dependent helicase HrpA n=1 Tax=Desulfacinum hydrothermale DSM 13146 TaxID=1121390 RepID=A0A1W1X4D7_9BACT|nr:ATP-dependent RNA helicase HrpA [Desulfacinum hydrothermale]SMC18747.1 ATP-dependent helicase HrpA [Desulfacinum hydrothermale DSM 13146]